MSNTATVACEICHREMPVVNSLHLRTHQIKLAEYLARYPHAILYSEDTRAKMCQNIKRAWDNPDSGFHTRNFPRTKASGTLKGKTYEGIYGHEKAQDMVRQRKAAGFGRRVTNEQRVKNLGQAIIHHPNKTELLFSERLNSEFPGEWKYVGNGEVWLGRANPDYINANGRKLLIEIFMPYFKVKNYGSVESYIQQRSTHFLQYGFRTIFLNLEEDFDSLIERVKEEARVPARGVKEG